MRVTGKYLKQWLIDKFKELEIDLEVIEIYKTRYNQWDYEGGAAHWVYVIGIPGDNVLRTHIFIFYPTWYLQKELNNGYELYLKLKDGRYLMEAEVNIRKIS